MTTKTITLDEICRGVARELFKDEKYIRVDDNYIWAGGAESAYGFPLWSGTHKDFLISPQGRELMEDHASKPKHEGGMGVSIEYNSFEDNEEIPEGATYHSYVFYSSDNSGEATDKDKHKACLLAFAKLTGVLKDDMEVVT